MRRIICALYIESWEYRLYNRKHIGIAQCFLVDASGWYGEVKFIHILKMDTYDPNRRLRCFSLRRIIFMSITNSEGRMPEERMRLQDMQGEE
jgi:hypothetical protein